MYCKVRVGGRGREGREVREGRGKEGGREGGKGEKEGGIQKRKKKMSHT